jgi:lipopolysaccharide export system permease protein
MIPLKEKPSDFANNEWKPEYLSYKQLRKYAKNFKGVSNKTVRNLLVELHYKTAFPFISLIMVLIGTPFAIKSTRGGVLMGMGMSIVIGLLYYTVIAVSYNLGKAGLLHPFVAAWLSNVIFTAIGIRLINKRA